MCDITEHGDPIDPATYRPWLMARINRAALEAPLLATRIAHLEAALAAAEARLRAVEALHGDRHWCIEPEREQLLFYRPTRDLWPCATLAALTPPQPAPEVQY